MQYSKLLYNAQGWKKYSVVNNSYWDCIKQYVIFIGIFYWWLLHKKYYIIYYDKKFKQWMSTIKPIATTRATTYLSFQIIEHKKPTINAFFVRKM